MKRFECKKKLSNKGFSLVELVVVIAIMAILIGVLAPTLLNNIEKARYSKDKQAFDTINTALQQVTTDEAAYKKLRGLTADETGSGNAYKYYRLSKLTADAVIAPVISSVCDVSDITESLSSAAYSGITADNIYIYVTNNATGIYVRSKNTPDYAAYLSISSMPAPTMADK